MDKKVIIHNQAVIDGLTKDTDNIEYVNNSLHYKPMVLKNTYTFEELKTISKFFDDWLRDSYIRGGDAIEVFGYDDTKSEKENKMTNHEKFMEIFGDTGEEVKATVKWLGKEYKGPVHMTEKEKFLEWLDEQICIRYTTGCDTDYIYVKDDKDKPIIMVSDFDVKPGFVYIRIDGLCGWKAILEVKEIIRKVSRERLDDNFDYLWNSIFGR